MQICFNRRKCPMLRRELPLFQRLLWATGYWVGVLSILQPSVWLLQVAARTNFPANLRQQLQLSLHLMWAIGYCWVGFQGMSHTYSRIKASACCVWERGLLLFH